MSSGDMNPAFIDMNPAYIDPFAHRTPTPAPPPPRGLPIISGVLSICTSALYLVLGAFMLLIGSLVLAIFMPGEEVVSRGLLSHSGLVALAFTLLAVVGVVSGAFTIARRRWACLLNALVQLLFAAAWIAWTVYKPNALSACFGALDLAIATLSLVGLRRLSIWAAQVEAV
jgi:hypothetical protein